jgi:hypothetical protein
MATGSYAGAKNIEPVIPHKNAKVMIISSGINTNLTFE